MYIVGNEITISWVLPPTGSPLTQADYDIKIIPSDLNGTYTDAAVTGFVAPSAGYAGSITYAFTPISTGRYMLWLTTGAAASYTILDEKDFWVFLEAPVSTACDKAIGVISRGGVSPLPITNDGAAWNDVLQIYDIASDGTNVLVVGTKAGGTSFVWKTDNTLTSVTEIVEYESGGFSNWQSFRYLEFIEYSPKHDRWVCSNEQGDIYYSDDVGATWTAVTYASGWSPNVPQITRLHWNPHLEVWFAGSANISVLMISTDGITWTRQQDTEVLGGSHPYKLYNAGTYDINNKKVHILSQWEEYCYKTVDTGGSTGWTKTTNQGVIGGVSTWTLRNWVSDGNTIMVSAFGRISMNADPTAHISWQEHTAAEMNIPNLNIRLLANIPSFDRPWLLCHAADDTWYDIDSVTPTGAPQWTKTSNPFFDGRAPAKISKWNTTTGRFYKDLGNGKWAVIFDDYNFTAPVNTVRDKILMGL